MQIWSAILSNTKTAEEIRDGSPSFTIRLVLVKNVTLKKFKVVNHCQIQRQRRRFVTGVRALLLGWSELKCHLEKIQGCKPLSNTKTTEEIRDGSPSFTIRLVLVKMSP